MDNTELIGGVDPQKWFVKFKGLAAKDFYARRSWQRLKELGFSDDLIQLGFFLAADFPGSPGYEVLAEMRQESQRRARRAAKLVRLLVTARQELADLLEVPLGSPVRNPPGPNPPDPESRQQVTASPRLRDAFSAAFTSAPRQGPEERADTDKPGEPVLEHGKGRASGNKPSGGGQSLYEALLTLLSPASDRTIIEGFEAAIARAKELEEQAEQFALKRLYGPSVFLGLGISWIQKKAKQPLYRDYTNILNVAYQAFERDDRLATDDSVRKAYRRFVERDPELPFTKGQKIAGVTFLLLTVLGNLIADKSSSKS